MGRLQATLTLLKYFKAFFSARGAMNKVFQLTLLRMLEGLNLLDFLKTPRTVEEIREKIGGVSNEDFFKDFLDILLDVVAVRDDDKILLNFDKVKEIESYENSVVVRDFKKLFVASKEIFPEMFKAIIRNIKPRFDWEYTIVTNFALHSIDIYRKAREIVLNFANAKSELKGGRLLDLSAGFGYEVEHLLKYFDGDIEIVVASFSERILNLAKKYEFEFKGKKVALEEVEQIIDFVLLDPRGEKDWGLDANSFDGAIAFSLLHWVPNPEKFVKNVQKVLKPKKQFFGFTVFYDKEVPKWADFFIKIQGGNRFLTIEEFNQMCIKANFQKPKYFAKMVFKTRKII